MLNQCIVYIELDNLGKGDNLTEFSKLDISCLPADKLCFTL